MSPDEAFAICRLAKGAFPATTMDEFTPESWSLALEDDRFPDARDALKSLMREQTFIHVSDIVQRIKRIRSERITAYGPIEPPASLDPSDTQGYNDWFTATRRAIADGDLKRDAPESQAIQSRDDAAARVKELRAQLARRAPTPERPTFAALASSAAAADDARQAAARQATPTAPPPGVADDESRAGEEAGSDE